MAKIIRYDIKYSPIVLACLTSASPKIDRLLCIGFSCGDSSSVKPKTNHGQNIIRDVAIPKGKNTLWGACRPVVRLTAPRRGAMRVHYSLDSLVLFNYYNDENKRNIKSYINIHS